MSPCPIRRKSGWVLVLTTVSRFESPMPESWGLDAEREFAQRLPPQIVDFKIPIPESRDNACSISTTPNGVDSGPSTHGNSRPTQTNGRIDHPDDRVHPVKIHSTSERPIQRPAESYASCSTKRTACLPGFAMRVVGRSFRLRRSCSCMGAWRLSRESVARLPATGP